MSVNIGAQMKSSTSSMKTGSGSGLVSGVVSSGVAVFSTYITVEKKLQLAVLTPICQFYSLNQMAERHEVF